MPEIVACTAVHPLADGEVRLLGAVETVTGAMTRVEIGGKKVLVDCGIGQGREAESWEMPDAARDVDAVILTHGHLDHIGSVPRLIEKGFNKPILATKATLDIARISLDDALGMNGANDREIERFMARFNQLAKSIPYDVYGAHLPGFNLSIGFREAGHILGSASVEITSSASRIILSGDLGRPHSPILRDANEQWRDDKPVDVVVMESTYGSRNHEHGHDDIEKKLADVVNDAFKRKAKVLIPSFAIGRTQVLMYFLNELVEAGKIPAIPVAIDTPMGQLVTDVYKNARKLFDKESLRKIAQGDDPLDFEELFSVRRGKDSHRLVESDGPMIVIAGSGMCQGGRIMRHLKAGLPDPETTVLFVGHQSVGTKGRVIQEAKETGKKVYIEGEEIPVRCRIDTLRGLSAHADRDELLTWVGHIPNVKRVALHHGEVSAQHALCDHASEKGFKKLEPQS
jgi:metallo-beta-lactamase family protein